MRAHISLFVQNMEYNGRNSKCLQEAWSVGWKPQHLVFLRSDQSDLIFNNSCYIQPETEHLFAKFANDDEIIYEKLSKRIWKFRKKLPTTNYPQVITNKKKKNLEAPINQADQDD